MAGNFWLQYIFALVVVALMLGGLYAIVRGLARGRVLLSSSNRLITVVESTVLSQHASLHVVKACGRYVLVGASNGHVSTLGDLPGEDVDAWLAAQRDKFGARPASIVEALSALRQKR